MGNVAIYKKGANNISFFIKDCIKDGNNFDGSNCKLHGIKLNLFDYIWTNDDVDLVDNQFNKNVSELTIASSTDNTHRNKPTRNDYKDSLKFREKISSYDFSQIDSYVDNNVTDLESAKTVLKYFGKCILSLCKEIDFKR